MFTKVGETSQTCRDSGEAAAQIKPLSNCLLEEPCLLWLQPGQVSTGEFWETSQIGEGNLWCRRKLGPLGLGHLSVCARDWAQPLGELWAGGSGAVGEDLCGVSLCSWCEGLTGNTLFPAVLNQGDMEMPPSPAWPSWTAGFSFGCQFWVGRKALPVPLHTGWLCAPYSWLCFVTLKNHKVFPWISLSK